MSRKKLIVIFPDEWLSHSPTPLNLVTCLSSAFDVKLVTFDDGCFSNDQLCDDRYEFIRINTRLASFFLRRIRVVYGLVKSVLLLKWLRIYCRTALVDEVIAIDSLGLWVAQKVFSRPHFVSLEIKKDLFFKLSNKNQIGSLVIQTEARSAFFFKHPLPNTFLVPNSPIIDRGISYGFTQRAFNGKIVFLGNVNPNHGLYTCLDTVRRYQERFTSTGLSLTLKGVITKQSIRNNIFRRYQDLLDSKLVTLDETYEPQDQIVEFLSHFSIGICFYDFRLISKDDFNYLSCPSGKLFNYLAAGVPIIGTDIPGLHDVRTYRTGVLIKQLSTESVYQAIENIRLSFREYRENAFLASKEYDFEKKVVPYRDFLMSRYR